MGLQREIPNELSGIANGISRISSVKFWIPNNICETPNVKYKMVNV